MTNGFPLFRLPPEALANVLRSMDSIDCFLFTLCSQRCKRSVAELNLETSQFVVAFEGFHIGMFIKFADTSVVHVAVLPHFPINQDLDLEVAQDFRVGYYPPEKEDYVEELGMNVGGGDRWPQTQVVEDAGRVLSDELNREWRLPKQFIDFNTLSFKSWYDHCKEIYHLKQITAFPFYHIMFHIEIEQLGRILGRIPIGRIEAFIDPPEALEQFLALRLSCKWFWLNTHLFGSSRSLQKAMINNIDRVYITDDSLENVLWLTLNDLLVANASELTICSHRISQEDLNIFLKLWIDGSNPRLMMLEIDLSSDPNESVLMRNIPHVKMSWEDLRQKLVEHGYGYTSEEEFAHNFNIRSVYGREATFTFGVSRCHGPQCRLFVWN